MKKLIISVMTVAFALAVQAGDAKTSKDSDKAACCSKAKSSDQAKSACCSMTKGASCKAPGKQALLSPKAAAEASR